MFLLVVLLFLIYDHVISTQQLGTFHPGHKVLSHLPRRIRNQLLKTKLLDPYVPALSTSTFVHYELGFGGLTVSPTDYGGDPTGMKDSTEAVLQAVEFCINASSIIPRNFPDGAKDAAGCTVDLEGGEFLISETLTIPTYVSNMRIQTGSLVANKNSTYWMGLQQPPKHSGLETKSESKSKFKNHDSCAYPTNRTGQWCQDLRSAPVGGDESAAACEALCCQTAACNAWQFCPAGRACAQSLPSNTSFCWFAPEGNPGGAPYDADANCQPSTSDPKSIGWIGASSKYPPVPYPFFLISVGNTEQCISPHQGSCIEDIGFPGLFLDGNNVANGIQISQVMGLTIGPQTYLLNFTSVGIQVNTGHEVMIDQTWLGETNFDHNYSAPGAGLPRAIAIDIRCNDHYILNSIVFSSLIGLRNLGAANMVNGLHVWFPLNEALKFGGTAFLDSGHQNRYQNCYIDASVAVLKSPSSISWLDGITLGGRGIELDGDVNGLVIMGTISGRIAHTGPSNSSIIDAIITANPGAKNSSIATQTMKSQVSTPQGTFIFNFCQSLPFARIASVTSAVFTSSSSNDFPVVVARQPSGCTVTIDVNPPAAGSLTITVDSSL